MAFINATPTKGRVTLTISERCPVEGRIEPRASTEIPIQATELLVEELRSAIITARAQERELATARRNDVARELEAARSRVSQLETALADTAALGEAP